MLRSAHVLKGAGNVDLRTFAGTAMALLGGWGLETILIMKYAYQRTYRALVNEELRGGLQQMEERREGDEWNGGFGVYGTP